MSYLYIDSSTLDDFTQVTISLWFRIPQSSIDAAVAATTGEEGKLLDGIIPLVVMGKKGSFQDSTTTYSQVVQSISYGGDLVANFNHTSTTTYEPFGNNVPQNDFHWKIEDTFNVPPPSFVENPPYYSYARVANTAAGDKKPRNPTFIGVNCSERQGFPALRVNFETAKVGESSSYSFEISSISPGIGVSDSATDIFFTTSGTATTTYDTYGFAPPVNFVQTSSMQTYYHHNGFTSSTDPVNHYTDTSNLVLTTSGSVVSDTIPIFGPTGDGDPAQSPLTADEWHHVLISLKLQTMTTHGTSSGGEDTSDFASYVDSWSQLFIAYDDVNYTEFGLSNNWVYRGDPNGVINDDASSVAGSRIPLDSNQKPLGGIPQYSLSDPTIPCNGQPMGLPATAEFVDDVYHVEMAEFQMFVGVQVDTGDDSIRRYFIDDQGKPVSPNKKASKTDSTVGSIAGLGQQPDILLHGSSNWIKGRNTGFLGLDSSQKPPKPIPNGQFTPTGAIKSYKPDPSLHGKQGAPQIQLSRKRRPEPVQ